MTASVPWSVNAVEPETWAAARDAARRSGVSVGEWLDTAIRDCAAERGRMRREAARAGGDPIEHRLDDIADRLDDFARRTGDPAGVGRNGARDTALLGSIDALNARIDGLAHDMQTGGHNGPVEVRSAIQRLDDRIEDLISRGRLAGGGTDPELERKLTHIAESLESMSRRLEQENRQHMPGPIPSSVAELDAAVADIMMRQSLLDGVPLPRDWRPAPPRDWRPPASAPMPPAAPAVDFSGLESKLQIMADEMQALRRASVKSETIDALRQEIADLAGNLSELAPRRSLEALEARIEQLVQRVDQALDGNRPDRMMTEVSRALHDIREALANVHPAESFNSVQRDLQDLSSKLDRHNAGSVDGDAVARMQEQTAELRALLESALPGDVLRALVDQVEALARKVGNGPAGGADPALFEVMNAFDRRIETLSERIESAARQMPPAPAIEEIRTRLDELQNAVGNADRAPTNDLQATLRNLSDKVEAADRRLANLSTLEQGLSGLFGQLQEARASVPEAAERAAKSVMREMAQPAMAQPPIAQTAMAQPDRALRQLPELETKYTSRAAAPAMPTEPEFENVPAAATSDYPRTERFQAPPIASSPSPIEPSDVMAADLPLEPGSGAPRMRLQSAALRVAQSQAALGDIAPEQNETPGRTLDYIAAARRAARAAANEPSAEPVKAPKKTPRRAAGGIFQRGRAAFLIALTAFLVIFTAMRFFQDHLPDVFPQSVPTNQRPDGLAPQSTAPQPVAPAEEEVQVMLDGTDAIVVIETPALGAISIDKFYGLPGVPPADPTPTGSTVPIEPGPIVTAEPATVPEPPEIALPAALGTSALRTAALAGDAAAAYEIGVRYLEGRGLRANTAEAIDWLERALKKGSAPAAYMLGSIFEKGQGVEKNPAEARRYYLIGAEGGNVKAMHNLAVGFAEGSTGKADPRTAARWFRMAAERGIGDSQYNLGVLYARGLGVEQNFAESFRWFALAASQGDKEAAARRDDVAKRLDAQSLAAIRQAAKTWSPRPVDEDANEVRLKPEWATPDASVERRRAIKK